MESALIVTHSEKGLDAIKALLRKISCTDITVAKTCGAAKRLSSEKNFDLYIINSPVVNESGEDLARELVSQGISQVIFVVQNDMYDYISDHLENLGVITIGKPINKVTFWTSLKLAKSTFTRLEKYQKQNDKLTKKLDDIKLINRAKLTLISNKNMSEIEAHKYIERKAMDTRSSRRDISKNILNEYEN